MNPDDMKLCYVDKYGFAWFTSCSIETQWGDDWDDAPYEHNAGPPYTTHYEGTGSDRCRVEHHTLKVAYESDHVTPCEGQMNSRWSVREINRGNVAWLSVPNWRIPDDNIRPIMTGTSLSDFVRLIEDSGGAVYLPREAAHLFESELS